MKCASDFKYSNHTWGKIGLSSLTGAEFSQFQLPMASQSTKENRMGASPASVKAQGS